MKKRILSLLLVLCMVLSIVPVAALSVFAEDGEAVTDTDTEALPSSTLTPEAVTLPESGGKVTLPAGWSFVAHGAQEHPDTTAPHNGYETTYVLDTYVTGGIYCALTGAENGTGTDFAASWDPNNNGIDVTRLPVICFNGAEAMQIDMGINACVVYSGGYAYEAPYTGNITIDLANVATGGGTTGGGWGGPGDTLVALFVGGEMVWPADGSYDDRATWYNLNGNGGQNKTDLIENGVTVENVPVVAGQSVEFLVFHSWWDNPVRADMTVAYTEVMPSSTLDRDDPAITLDENYKIVLPKGWSLIARNVNDYADAKDLTTVYEGESFVAGLGGEGGWILADDINDWGATPRVPWLNKGDRFDWHGAWLGLGPSEGWNAGYVYTAEYTGYVDINIDEIVYADHATNDDWDCRKYIAIFVDGTMVWPTKDGSYTNEADWISAGNALTDTDLSLLKGLYVKEGQKVELLATSVIAVDAVYVGWTVAYTSVQKPIITVFNRDSIQVDTENKKVDLSQVPGWELVGHKASNWNEKVSITEAFVSEDNIHTEYLYAAEHADGLDRNGNIPQINWNWHEDANTWWGPWMGAAAGSNWTSGYAYTAPANGTVDIDITALRNFWDGSKAVAIFVDGTMVWPTAGGSYTDAGDWIRSENAVAKAEGDVDGLYTGDVANAELLKGVSVRKGQVIEFLVKNAADNTNPGPWQSTQADLQITYTEILDGSSCYINLRSPSGALLEQIPVVPGDTVELPAYPGSGICLGWDADGNGTADYKTGDTVTVNEPIDLVAVLAQSVFHRDMVMADENYVVTLPAGWEIVAHVSSDYTNQVVLNTIYSGADQQVGPNEWGEGWIFSPDLGWGTSPNVPWFNQSDSDWCWGAWMGLGSSDAWTAGYSYTAAYSGKVDISIDEIVDLFTRSAGDWASPMKYIAIFVNGEMVWPTANGSYSDASEWFALNVDEDGNGYADYVDADGNGEKDDIHAGSATIDLAAINASIPKNIFVSAGDKIELLAKSNANTDAVYVGMTVNYTELVEDATATAAITLGEKFSVKFEVTPDELATECGIYIDGKKCETLSIDDIVAADLAAPFIYVPYQVVNGVELKGAAGTISVLDILAQYTAENGYDEKTVALAQAIINYGYAAEAYFYEFDLAAEIKAIVDTMAAPEAKNAKITDTIEETATFTKANIYLNDAITLKVFFTADNATDLKVIVEGLGEATVTIEEKGGNTYAAVIELPMAAYGTDLKITVYDGETQISETLTYSVEIYAARTYDAAATGEADLVLNDLLKTIVNLGKAAAAYNA